MRKRAWSFRDTTQCLQPLNEPLIWTARSPESPGSRSIRKKVPRACFQRKKPAHQLGSLMTTVRVIWRAGIGINPIPGNTLRPVS